MTVSDALISLNSFPIPTSVVEKIGIERSLDISVDYTEAISKSSNFELATADVYMWLHGQPIFKEQEISFSQQTEIKENFLSFANNIYQKYDDDKYQGKGKFGFIGESFNG